jgi:3-phenylpropionate/trans-cinnamate dioxygenase ferredoxin component
MSEVKSRVRDEPSSGGARASQFRRGEEDEMAEFQAVASADDVGDGEMARFKLADATVAVANVSGRLFAFDDVCTHKGCSLSKGDLEGVTVVCPCHGGQYDLASGTVLAGPPPHPVNVYPVRVVDGRLEIQI